jgi:hypothetical protein
VLFRGGVEVHHCSAYWHSGGIGYFSANHAIARGLAKRRQRSNQQRDG